MVCPLLALVHMKFWTSPVTWRCACDGVPASEVVLIIMLLQVRMPEGDILRLDGGDDDVPEGNVVDAEYRDLK